jgi:S1-C subfamily serine protease
MGRLRRWTFALFTMLLLAVACAIYPERNGSGEARTLPVVPVEQAIARSARSVCLIQGSYVFRDKENGEVLRRKGWFLGGDDSIVEKAYSGTGFLVSSRGGIVTNRHIAEPWWADPGAQKIISAGYRPELTSLKAHFPGRKTTHSLRTVRTSKEADLALLQADPARDLPAPLALGDEEGSTPGGKILLIGYPGGLGPILGRGAQSQLANIPGSLNFSEQQVTQALATRDLLEPFVSFGYLSNVSAKVLTLAIQTSDGSSGSPVLDEHGSVIAIHFATLTSAAGGGLAVPVRVAQELINHQQGSLLQAAATSVGNVPAASHLAQVVVDGLNANAQ